MKLMKNTLSPYLSLRSLRLGGEIFPFTHLAATASRKMTAATHPLGGGTCLPCSRHWRYRAPVYSPPPFSPTAAPSPVSRRPNRQKKSQSF